MEKKSVKRTVKKNKLSKRIVKKSRYIAALIAWYSVVFCYKRRKMLSLLMLVGFLSFGCLTSYKYVQAKMQETSSFSDKFILQKVRNLTPLPDGNPESLVRVENPEKLRGENPFYSDIKEGDYIIAYPKMFIIYDALHNEIKKIKESSKGRE